MSLVYNDLLNLAEASSCSENFTVNVFSFMV